MRYVVSALVLLASTAAFSGWVDFGLDTGGAAGLELIESTPSGMIVELTLPGVEVTPVIEQGTEYSVLSLQGTTPNALAEGYPMLPKVSFLAALPSVPSVSIAVTEADEISLGRMTPYPMQPILPDNHNGPTGFVIDSDAYSSGQTIPGQYADYTVDGVLRGVTVGRFALTPFSWNSETGEITVARRLRVEIDFGGIADIEPRLYSRFFEGIFRQHLINAEVLGEAQPTISRQGASYVVARNSREADAIDGADLLILAGDDFVDTMLDDFATTKHNQGFYTAVVAAGTWGEDSIKTYVEEAYNTWTLPPSFLLFVGDAPQIPPYYTNGINSDNRYACMDGSSDYMADIFHGRFVVPTDNYFIIENKILKWEFDPLMDPTFWGTALCAGMFQDNDSDGIADRWFLFTCETVRDTYMGIYGNTVEREYVKSGSASPPLYYRPDLPSAGQEVPSDITWTGSATGINNAINSGVFLVQHRDHGSVSGWADPPYYISDLGGLSNGDKTPVVMSINCSTGAFTSDCFAENFFKMEGGAVMVVAASATSYSYFNDYFCYGMYYSFNDEYTSPPAPYTFPQGNYMAAQAMWGGKMEMQTAAPFNPYGSWEAYAEDEWDLFHVFGDPTMDMRTEVPVELLVDAPTGLPVGATEATFTLSTADAPVEGGLVCIRKPDDDIWASGYTDAAGSVTLTFDPVATQSEAYWMATSHNTLHDEGVIYCVGIEDEQGQVPQTSFLHPWPNPSSGTVVFPVSIAGSATVEIGIFDIAGRMVAEVTSGSLPEGQHELVWDGMSNGIPVPVGLYVARITVPGGPTAVERIVIAR